MKNPALFSQFAFLAKPKNPSSRDARVCGQASRGVNFFVLGTRHRKTLRKYARARED